MAQVTFSINAVDKTRAAFASVNQGLNNLVKGGDATQKKLLMMGLQAVGLGSILAVLGTQVRKVAQDTENVPGISDDTIRGWNKLKNIAGDTGGVLQNMVATAGQGISNLISLVQFGWTSAFHGVDAAQKQLLENDAADAMSAKQAAQNVDRQIESMKKLGEARKQLRLLTAREDDAGKIVRERAEAAQLQTQADATADLAKKNDLLTQSVNLQIDARKTLNGLEDKDKAAMKASADVSTEINRVWMSSTSSLKELNAERAKTLALIQTPSMADDPHAIQRNIDLNTKLTDIDKQRLSIMKEQKQFAMEVGATMASGFEDAIISGGKLSDVLKGMAQDLLRLVIRNTVTKNLANLIGGAVSGFFGSGGGGSSWGGGATPSGGSTWGVGMQGMAVGGPLNSGQTVMVGEEGPELFTPSQAGRIIPNHQINGGAGNGGNIYQIDARGADAGAVDRISQALIRLAGPGVVERRAISAVTNRRVRGGTLAAAL